MPSDLIVVMLVVAAFCLGVAVRGYYDEQDAVSAAARRRAYGQGQADMRAVVQQGVRAWSAVHDGGRLFAIGEPPLMRMWTYEFPSVTFLDLPYFIRRRSEDKGIARFIRARDTFEPIR